MSFHTPPHKHVGDEGKPGQIIGHLSSSDNIPSPTGRMTKSEPEWQELPKTPQRTNGDRMLETFAGASACKLWWPTDNGR